MTPVKFLAQEDGFFKAKASHLAVIASTTDLASLNEVKNLDKEMAGRLALSLANAKADKTIKGSFLSPTASLAQLVIANCLPEKSLSEEERRGELRREVEKAVASISQGFESSALTGADGVAHIWMAGDAARMGAHAALGATLGLYHFDKYRDTKGAYRIKEVVIHVPADGLEKAQKCWAELSSVEAGIFMARDLVNEPANELYPAEFAKRIKELEKAGLEIEILDEAKMKDLGFGALLGVAQGSANKPYVAIMQYKGGKNDPIAFVGKGVTFDTGGISIKPAGGMEEMKADMGGAAAVVGTMLSLAKRKAKVNAVGVVGLVENMPSSTAQRPGDIVRAYDGQTIEVLNTDAEGRLVLADILSYTAKRFSPKWMIDLATLTGAIIISLGEEKAGMFAGNQELGDLLLEAGKKSGEYLWPMPMGKEYAAMIKSDVADLQNISGGRAAGSVTAAEFLKCFTRDVPWVHLDIAGTAFRTKGRPLTPKGATGFGVRLLDKFVRTYEKSDS